MFDRNERVARRIGDLVDDDHLRSAGEPELRQRRPNRVGRGGRGDHRGGACIAQRGLQTLGVPLEFRREQRHGDGACLDRSEESCDVVEALRSEDRHPVTGRGQTLHTGTDGSHATTELRPGEFDGLTVCRARVIQVAVRHGVADIGDVAVDQRYQRDTRRQHDAAVGIQTVLDLQEALSVDQSVPRNAIHGTQCNYRYGQYH